MSTKKQEIHESSHIHEHEPNMDTHIRMNMNTDIIMKIRKLS